jgi:hypothetical protein
MALLDKTATRSHSLFPFLARLNHDGSTSTRRRVPRPLQWLLGAFGFDVLPRHYYSPVPDIASIPVDIWASSSALSGIDWDLERQFTFFRERLVPYLAEFQPPREERENPWGFFLDNAYYGSVDAECLYGMIRHLKPRRIIEVGSGYSTLITACACVRNRQEGHHAHFASYDPSPGEDWQISAARHGGGLSTWRRLKATELPLSEFMALRPGDVLFVDTTHTVKTGSEVNYLILDVLPVLQPGVVVHFHDIFLPWEYPRKWVVDDQRFWSEQYLLQAFLACNRSYEVLFAAHAVARERSDMLSEVLPSFDHGLLANRLQSLEPVPAAFWLRRVADEPEEPERG